MTSKLKCTFCEYELQENGATNLCCPICGLVAPTKLWKALIQSTEDLRFIKNNGLPQWKLKQTMEKILGGEGNEK